MTYVYTCPGCGNSIESYVYAATLRCNLDGMLLERDYKAESVNIDRSSLR